MSSIATVPELHAQGNAAFSAGNYELALDCYSRALLALEADPSSAQLEVSLLSNRAAAHLAKFARTRAREDAGSLELALRDAELVIAKRPDWEKGWLRKATALRLTRGRETEALGVYAGALGRVSGQEARAHISLELESCKKQLRALIESQKVLGNSQMHARRYAAAAASYSEAIATAAALLANGWDATELCDDLAVLHSNRSAAHASAGELEAAVVDARECMRLRPSWYKGYGRLGAALQMAGRPAEAEVVYADAVPRVDAADRWRIEKERDSLSRKRGLGASTQQNGTQQRGPTAKGQEEEEESYYQILGLEKDAGQAQIKKVGFRQTSSNRQTPQSPTPAVQWPEKKFSERLPHALAVFIATDGALRMQGDGGGARLPGRVPPSRRILPAPYERPQLSSRATAPPVYVPVIFPGGARWSINLCVSN